MTEHSPTLTIGEFHGTTYMTEHSPTNNSIANALRHTIETGIKLNIT